MTEDVLIEGYASLFGEADMAGDIVRAGAFARTLRGGGWQGAEHGIPMLLQHRGGHIAGRWTRLREDGRGLYVRGLIERATPAGRAAMKLVERGLLDGLSIGFIARTWQLHGPMGRVLSDIDLREVSLVASPMARRARFSVLAGEIARAAA